MLFKKSSEFLSLDQIVEFVNKDFLRFWVIEIVFKNSLGNTFVIKTKPFNYDFYSQYYYNSLINAKYIPYYPDGIPEFERKQLIYNKILLLINDTVSIFNSDLLSEYTEKKFLLLYLNYN